AGRLRDLDPHPPAGDVGDRPGAAGHRAVEPGRAGVRCCRWTPHRRACRAVSSLGAGHRVDGGRAGRSFDAGVLDGDSPLLVFGGMLGWLPLGGIIDGSLEYRRITGAPLLDGLVAGNWTIVRSSVRHLVLPAVALGSTAMAAIASMGRSTMLDVLGLDFIRTARAKGLAERRVVSRHAL